MKLRKPRFCIISVKEQADIKMPAFKNHRSIFTLTSSFGFLLALYRRLFVVFSFTNLSDNAVLSAGSLEALESGI